MLGESHTSLTVKISKGKCQLLCLRISGFILTEIPQNDCICYQRSVYYCLQNKEQHTSCWDSDKHIAKFSTSFLYLLTHGVLIHRYSDPSFRKFLLIPNRINKFYGSHSEFFYPMLSSILLGFDQYLVICVYLAFSVAIHLKGTQLKHQWLWCMYFSLPNISKPMYIQ
jgi:hypothetical protein